MKSAIDDTTFFGERMRHLDQRDVATSTRILSARRRQESTGLVPPLHPLPPSRRQVVLDVIAIVAERHFKRFCSTERGSLQLPRSIRSHASRTRRAVRYSPYLAISFFFKMRKVSKGSLGP